LRVENGLQKFENMVRFKRFCKKGKNERRLEKIAKRRAS